MNTTENRTGWKCFPAAAASGNVDDAGDTAINLVALEAATAENNLIECALSEIGAAS